MTKRVIIVCEGKSDYKYLTELQRFIKDEIRPPEGSDEPALIFVPYPDPEGVMSGSFGECQRVRKEAKAEFPDDPVENWVDSDIYIRNETYWTDRESGKEFKNGDEYRKWTTGCEEQFLFSHYNVEDFFALHYDDAEFQKWKAEVLLAVKDAQTPPHKDLPLPGHDYSRLYQKFNARYSKGKFTPAITINSLANLRRNLADPDVLAMSQRLQPGIHFGSYLLALFDEIYPGLIPGEGAV